jgi:hypothetical protein
MSNYLENLKWFVSNPSPTNNPTNNDFTGENIKANNFVELPERHDDAKKDLDLLISNYTSGSGSGSGSGSDIDSDHEYDKIILLDPQNINQTQQSNYSQIYLDLIEKEQLVRQSLPPDTVDKIKANYTEYLDSDVKIIKDFAGIMENFVHIKEQLKNFESDIKEFKQNIRTSNLAQISGNKLEFDEKINLIDEKIEKLNFIMNQTNNLVDDYMGKITHLENSIKENETHRKEIMLRLENFDKEHKEFKNNNTKFLKIFSDYQKHLIFSNNESYNWVNYVCLGLIGVGIGFGIKIGLKSLFSKK